METYILVVAVNGKEGDDIQKFMEVLRDSIIDHCEEMSTGALGTFDIHVTRESRITPP